MVFLAYCKLCTAAQAFYTEGLPEGIERPVLRTSGLLSRFGKVMYDPTNYSVFDTFPRDSANGILG